MRIVLVIYGKLDTPTGGYLYDSKLVEHLESEGHEVFIISQEQQSYLQNIEHNFSDEFLGEMRDIDPDIILEDELNHIALFEANRRLKERIDRPIVAIVHHLGYLASRSERESEMLLHFERLFLGAVDGFVYNSEATRNSVENVLGKETKGVIAYPGKNHLPVHREEIPKDPDDLRMLFVGNVVPHKGLDIVLEAMALLDGREIYLDVIGANLDSHYLSTIRYLVRRNRLEERVAMHGFVPRDRLERMMNCTDVLVVPSFMEGYGIVYAEALGHGLPVIASNVGGAREVLDDECAILVEPGNIDQLSAEMLSLINDRSRLKRMGEAALRRYSELPNWDESMKTVSRFLLQMVKRME